MTKCQVQWVRDGKPTPDDNDAVMMAHFHEPIWGTPGPNNKIQGYGEIRESFPICAEHYAMVDASFRLPRGGWTFTPIDPLRDADIRMAVEDDLAPVPRMGDE